MSTSYVYYYCPNHTDNVHTHHVPYTIELVIFKGEFKDAIFTVFFAMDSISVMLSKYFKVLYFTNLVCTTIILKYKSLENFQLCGT